MKTERNYGLDLYRLLAMLMITALHVNYQQLNLMEHNVPSGSSMGYLIEYICFCGVNCFALLTGFLFKSKMNYDKKWFSKVFDIFCKVVIFGFIVYFTVLVFSASLSFNFKIFCYIIVQRGSLWYIGAYLGLMMFLPILSGITFRHSSRELLLFSTFSFALFSCFTVIYRPVWLCLGGGYSIFWLMICFIWGQALQSLAPIVLRWKYNTVFLLSGALIGGIAPFIFYKLQLPGWNRFMSYLSPFCIFEAVCLLLLFSKIKITGTKKQKILKFISSMSLGIYLFQANPVVWRTIFTGNNAVQKSIGEILWKFPVTILTISVLGILVYYLVEKIYQIPVFGWIRDKFWAIINGIISLIFKEHV